MAAADGGVFAFGDAAYEGSDQGSGATPVVGIAARPGGYWLAYSTTAPLSSALGEEQALALLGYLPLSWSPSGFAWRWAVPSTLSSLWVPGQPNVVLTGAAMTFEAENGLSLSGVLDGAALALLSTLLSNLDAHLNAFGYTYVLVNEHAPETLTLYRNGVPVLQTPANTGGYGTPTALGTYPIYERLLNQVMTGVTPAGVHYADPVSFVSYFNGGDALHYMPRATYGDPQSLGCVELPLRSGRGHLAADHLRHPGQRHLNQPVSGPGPRTGRAGAGQRAALLLVVLADGAGRGAQCLEGAQEPTVGLFTPAHIARAPPARRAQGVEAPVIADPGERVALDLVVAQLGQGRPRVEAAGPARRHRPHASTALPRGRARASASAAASSGSSGARTVSGDAVVKRTSCCSAMACILATPT